MGSAASTNAAMFPEDIRKTYQDSEQIKDQIAQRDAVFIRQQASQAWKNHKQIISALTQRTKSQLQRVACIYEKMRDDSYTKPAYIEIRDMLGGTYGEFMSLLLQKRETINIELLDVAFKSIGCDECLVADVLCACSKAEMIETQTHYDASRDTSLQEMIRTKCLEKSSFQRFVQCILTTKRNDEDVFDDTEALAQMEALHAQGVAGTSRDEDAIFRGLSTASRTQCDLISRHYERVYQCTLGEALSKMFVGSVQRALLLWISPLLASMASLFYLSLHSTVVDFDLTCHLATKYNKSSLQAAVVVYKTLYEEDLVERLGKKLTGNFKKSVIAWLTSATYDGGAESKIEAMVEESGGDLTKLLADPAKLSRLRELVEEEKAASEKQITAMEAADKSSMKNGPALAKSSAAQETPAPAPPSAQDTAPPVAPGLAALSRAASTIQAADAKDSETNGDGGGQEGAGGGGAQAIAALVVDDDDDSPNKEEQLALFSSPSRRRELGYEEKFKLICDYLLERFKQDDLDDSGTLDSAEFWTTLRHLNVGYTDEELAAIEKWVDYDGDGSITYAEVVNELADNLILVIEASGRTVEDKVAELWEQNKMELETLWNEYNDWQTRQEGAGEQDLSPSLIQYLKDSFDAFDIDKNGLLDIDEFWQILTTVLGLTEGDKALVQVRGDVRYVVTTSCSCFDVERLG